MKIKTTFQIHDNLGSTGFKAQKKWIAIDDVIKLLDITIERAKGYKKNVENAEIRTAYGREENKARCMGYSDVITLLLIKRQALSNASKEEQK